MAGMSSLVALLLACTEYGYEAASDLDSEDSAPPTPALDEDGDGLTVDQDCDDKDPNSTAVADDGDCDGRLTEHDCDDTDPTNQLPADVDDPDCDGVSTSASGGELVLFEPGGFDVQMGCTADVHCDEDEYPPHPVSFSRWWRIGVTEVTQDQFELMLGYDPAKYKDCGGDCPVETVTWHMAVDYANALSTAAGLPTCYDCTGEEHDVICVAKGSPYACEGYRLPTEAEWEMAAKCNENTVYPGSDTVEEVGWYEDNSGHVTQPVAQKQANACGVYDMSGNVKEWMNDWYAPDYFAVSPELDPEGPADGLEWAVRGGDASYTGTGLRTSNRTKRDGGSPKHGFRVARTLHAPPPAD